MRVFVGVFLVVTLSVAAFAADLKVKVVDAQAAVVSGAQVSLISGNDGKVVSRQNTSAEGIAMLPGTAFGGAYRIEVLAPGFAAETLDVSGQAEITVSLRLATASETVVVTATRTPVAGEAAGADVDILHVVMVV